MTTVRTHYDNLLAKHYTWTLGGDLERVSADDRVLLEHLGVAGPRTRPRYRGAC